VLKGGDEIERARKGEKEDYFQQKPKFYMAIDSIERKLWFIFPNVEKNKICESLRRI
jgi:hypothetical protein